MKEGIILWILFLKLQSVYTNRLPATKPEKIKKYKN